ncbi:amidohydrolase family protein [Persicobacter diffluens]|uniref:Amidohydrolase-related domain-containing protein n=1 Tax=Persicobacter diffluens TaxID=981 RepID=A0AAN4W4X7_9BACT|nr:hypothetical protein PEDI_49040 [Persicobacter diffluens]
MNKIAERIQHQISFLEKHADHLVIDTDTHLTDPSCLHPDFQQKLNNNPYYYQGRPINEAELLLEMKQAAVDMALIWQNPACTYYTNDPQANFEQLLQANQYIADCAHRYPEKFIPAGWTDPKNCGLENALRIIETCVLEYGMPIIKLNPAQNEFRMDDPMVFTIVDKIIALKAIPAFHYGADTPFTPAVALENLAKRYPNHPIIAVHMGGGGAAYIEADEQYTESRKLGLKYPNIKFALSAKRDTHMESDLIAYQTAGAPFSNNLFCASDAPYGRISWNFGGFRQMFKSLLDQKNHPQLHCCPTENLFNDAAVAQYMGGNFVQLVLEPLKNIQGLITREKSQLV